MNDLLHDLNWVVPMRHEMLTPIFEFFTELGHVPFFLILLITLYWTWNKSSTHRVTILLLSSALLNLFLKDLFQDPRPKAFFMPGHGSDSFGLPSGHTQTAIVFWFALAMEIRKRWVWILFSILVVLIAFSRLYLGVHDVEDIIGGAILGGLTIAIYRAILPRLPRIPRPRILGTIGLIAILVLLLNWPEPIPVPDMAIIIYGFMVGWSGGFALERSRGGFERRPPIGRIVLSVFAGLVVVALFAGGLRFVLKTLVEEGLLPDYIAIGIGGCAVGFVITFAAPWLLSRLGLMKRA
jgi:glycerophosphoryl diester phosphodiesterase